MLNAIQRQIEQHTRVMAIVAEEMGPEIERCCRLMVEALQRGNKILVMGNGGSAADAQHFAAELVGRFLAERRALPSIALTTDTSILTAIGNDYGFDQVFKRQVEALATAGDIVVGISTSGRSENVLHALRTASAIGCKTVGLLGRDGGDIAGIVDVNLTVPVDETPRIQEAHSTIVHILCYLLERELFQAEPDRKAGAGITSTR